MTDDGTDVTVSVPRGKLVTGIDLSDKHIKKRYLEVGKYLTADLVVVRSELTLPGSKDAEGTLKLHGQSKTIKFHYDVTK